MSCRFESWRIQVILSSSSPINMVEKEGKTNQSPFAQSDRPSSDLPTHLNLRRTSGSADSSHKVLQTLVSRIIHFTTFIRAQGEPQRLTLLISRALVSHPNYLIHLLVPPSVHPTPTPTPDATILRGLRSPILDHRPLSNIQTGALIHPTVPIPVRPLLSLSYCGSDFSRIIFPTDFNRRV
jgi:hypothetical protein